MATNVILDGRNNMKRDDAICVSEVYATVGDFIIANIPEETVVLKSRLNVLKADTDSSANMDIVVNGVTVNSDIDVTKVGVNTGTETLGYFKTGGKIEVKTGSAAGAGDGLQQLILEYVELNKVNGEYTTVD